MSIRAGFVGVIGLPNAGKSTMVNHLIGEKVSIVTPRPQTTRQRVLGILSDTDGQVVFVDAPGLTDRPGALNEFLRYEFSSVLKDSDGLVVVIDMKNDPKEEIDKILTQINQSEKPYFIILNKMDLVDEAQMTFWTDFLKVQERKMRLISALDQSGSLKQLLWQDLLELVPICEKPLYDNDLYTTQNVRDMVNEIIREKCFACLRQEIPYGLAIRTLKFDEDSSQSLTKIYAEILVAKENHKPMVIGAKGAMLKEIGMKSREEIEKLLGKKVFLDLHVQARPEWMMSKTFMKELGYVRHE